MPWWPNSQKYTPNPDAYVTGRRKKGFQAPETVETDENIVKHEKTQEDFDIIKKAIKSNEFLHNILNENQIEQIAEAMYSEETRENETIIQEGDNGSKMYVSASGIYTVLVKGKEVDTFSDPKVFGELAILYKAKRLATIRALSKGKVWVIHRNVYQKILVQNVKKQEEELITFLKKVPNVNKLREQRLKVLIQIFKTEFFPPDTLIVQEGTIGDKFYIIHSGQVNVTRKAVGKVAELTRGEFFGEKALLQDDKRQATVTAKPPGVECLTLTRKQFLKYFDLTAFEDSANETVDIEFGPLTVNDNITDIKLDQLNMCSTLGEGGFGRVELVQHNKQKDLIFALKYLRKVDVVQKQLISHVFNEKNIQMKCDSVFIIKLYKTFKDSKYLYFLMEPCLGGDLCTLMDQQKQRKMTEGAAKFYTACVLEAISYLHDRKCVYRDIKPENLLIDTAGYLKLTDFGFAKSIGNSRTYTIAGTPEYVAPEIIYNRGHDKAADYWALGIFIFELLNGKTPFKTNDPSHMKTYQMIVRGIERVIFPKHMSNYSIEIVKKLCKPLPAERLGYLKNGANDIRKHKWFDGFDWEKLCAQKLKPPFVPKLTSNLDTRYFGKYKPDNDIPPDDLGEWDRDF